MCLSYESARELEQTVTRIFHSYRDVVICPFKPFKYEYRILVYNQQIELILRKSLPKVIGDGKQTLAQLVLAFLAKLDLSEQQKLMKDIHPNILFSQEVPIEGSEIPLHWKHNGGGATTDLIGGATYHCVRESKNEDSQDPLLAKLTDIALRTTQVLGIRFAAVDIAELVDDPKGKPLRVLEVNSAPMLDHKLETGRVWSEKSEKAVYTRIITDLFVSSSVQKSDFLLPDIEPPVSQPTDQKALNIAVIISRIAKANGWDHTKLSQGWISSLSTVRSVRQVYGYIFPLNSSTAAKICENKVSTSAVLKEAGIPQISHKLISASDPSQSLWATALDFINKHSFPVVCKPVKGSGGVGVELVKSVEELDSVIRNLSKGKADVAISKYKRIIYEYRLIMLDNEPEVIFRKVPPYITGDGIQSVQDLIQSFLTAMEVERRDKILSHIPLDALTSMYVPKAGEQLLLHWKHNLGQGAICDLLDGSSYREIIAPKLPENDTNLIQTLVKIAKATTQALDARFVSVDIAQVADEVKPNKIFRVLEVNSGIMMDHLMEQHGPFGVQLATLVYTRAFLEPPLMRNRICSMYCKWYIHSCK